MNNTFNLSRFGKVLRSDCRKYFRNFGITLAILCGLNLVLWLLSLIFNISMPTIARYAIIYIAELLAIIMVPAKAFGDINLQREGVRFAMLPASNLEKYLSYIFFCLMTPVLVIFGSWGIDSLLTLLPLGGFDHYIKSMSFIQIFKNIFTQLGNGGVVDATEESMGALETMMDVYRSPTFNFNKIMGIVFTVGLFMFGNLLFKTHKTGKTLACMIGLTYVINMILQLVLISRKLYPWLQEHAEDINITDITNIISTSISFSVILHGVLTIGLYIGLFYKLKNQKY